MLVTTLGYDDYRGVTALGRITAGRISAGQSLARLTTDGQKLPERARYLYVHQGLQRMEVNEAAAGEIIALAGLEGIGIGETLAGSGKSGGITSHSCRGTDRTHDLQYQQLTLCRT